MSRKKRARGPGRPRIGEGVDVRIVVYVDQATADKIDARRGDTSRNAFVREVLKRLRAPR